jgi:5-methylcytosine-specific restriction protein A
LLIGSATSARLARSRRDSRSTISAGSELASIRPTWRLCPQRSTTCAATPLRPSTLGKSVASRATCSLPRIRITDPMHHGVVSVEGAATIGSGVLRPCLGLPGSPCGALSPTTRCPTHTRAHDRTRRPNTTQRGYGAGWQAQSKAAIAAHVAEHGYWCPGYAVPPHPSTDLTTDHLVDGDASVVVVGCRSCNARKRRLHGYAWGGTPAA